MRNNADNELSIWNINSIINYIKDYYIQLLLLLLVPIIIYIVDYVSNINAILFGIPSAIPGLSGQQQKKNIKNLGRKKY